MATQDLSERLRQVARELRPPQRRGFLPLIPFAHRLNANVHLELSGSRTRTHAMSDLTISPVDVTIIRRSEVRGRQLLEPHDEPMLRPSERFSLAHELGHIIAFQRFGVQPELNGKDYWAQETCMNEFSQQLLVPDWLLNRWVETSKNDRPISPQALRTWGIEECGISQQVVATALSRVCHDVGFMTVTTCQSKKFGQPALKILFAASGSMLSLPPTHAHVVCPKLQDALSSKPFGVAELHAVKLVRDESQHLTVAWRKTQSFGADSMYWVSLAITASQTRQINSEAIQAIARHGVVV